MKEKKVIIYHDPLNDDFAGNNIKHAPLPASFKYVHKNIIWRGFATFFYRIVAVPILFLVSKIVYGVRVKGKRNTKELRKTGYFVYGNHTQAADGWNPQAFVMNGKRGYVVANQDATSIKGIRWFVQMLGCIPVPESLTENKKFLECLEYRIKQKAAIVIYPEKHIWPYYTHIRPFPDDSFVYPAELGVPVVAVCTTYEKRKIMRFRKPRMVLHVSKPIYPDMRLSLADRKKELRKEVYDFMIKYSAEGENEETYRYVYEPLEKEKES